MAKNMPFLFPLVLENVLKFLNARDLANCSQVCRLWNHLSEIENNQRKFIEWFLERRDVNGTLSRRTPSFQQQLASVRCHTSFCLVFLRYPTLRNINVFGPGVGDFPVPTITSRLEAARDCLSTFLPEQCQLHVFVVPNVIGCNKNGSPRVVKRNCGISGLLLPHFPGVSIQHISPLEDANIPDRPISGMLVFMNSFEDGVIVHRYIEECTRNNGEFAFAGIIVECSSDIISFFGDNVQMASVVLEQGFTEDVDNELSLFKKTGMLDNQCCAFMFSSCYEKREVKCFKNMYPNVPLTGVCGNMIIGNFFLPNADKDDPDHKQRTEWFSKKPHVRGYNAATIFLLLSVKTPK